MNKIRKTVNVSLQKRNLEELNNIINRWEDDGYTVSNEICEAILFKVASDMNPHVCTILSTLSLIESSIRCQKEYRDVSIEEIKSIALNIFNEVITIDIDGSKLTSLLKGGYKINTSEATKITSSSKDEIDVSPYKVSKDDIQYIDTQEEPIQYPNNKKSSKDENVINQSCSYEAQEESANSSTENSKDSSSSLDWRRNFPKEESVNSNPLENSNCNFDSFVYSSKHEKYA